MSVKPHERKGKGVMARLPQDPPAIHDVINKINPDHLGRVLDVGPTVGGRYLHWEEVRRRSPPVGLTTDEWWAGLALNRQAIARSSPILNTEGKPFRYSLVDPVLERLHNLDLRATGRLAMPAATFTPATRGRYRARGIIEEAISSSQLEGAVTKRGRAREMLRSGQRPRDISEKTIANNYSAIRRMREVMNRDLSPDLICEIHAILTEGTLDNPDNCGRFQRPEDIRAMVVNELDRTIFRPPRAEEIMERVERLCDFANGSNGGFIHPLLRSILLHFWLVYIHPFANGNGRTARGLFYWSALREDYWLMEYISISAVLLKAPAQYRDSFLYSETKDSDLTYFLIHQLNTLDEAFHDLSAYVDSVLGKNQEVDGLADDIPGLNERQRALLSNALRNPDRLYTFRGHANRHDISLNTARNDLLYLAEKDLIKPKQLGKQRAFIASTDLDRTLKELKRISGIG